MNECKVKTSLLIGAVHNGDEYGCRHFTESDVRVKYQMDATLTMSWIVQKWKPQQSLSVHNGYQGSGGLKVIK